MKKTTNKQVESFKSASLPTDNKIARCEERFHFLTIALNGCKYLAEYKKQTTNRPRQLTKESQMQINAFLSGMAQAESYFKGSYDPVLYIAMLRDFSEIEKFVGECAKQIKAEMEGAQ